MDVKCATCGEPWELYHLMHDAIWESDATPEELDALPVDLSNPRVKELLAEAGYHFGGHNYAALLRCPCCPAEDTAEAKDRRELVAALGDLLGDDSDGLASTLEDLDL